MSAPTSLLAYIQHLQPTTARLTGHLCSRLAQWLLLLLLLFVASPARAIPITLSSDLRTQLGMFCLICELQTEIDGFAMGTDRITFALSSGNPPTPPLGGYAFFDAPMVNNQPSGDMVITTVYGIDIDPTSAALMLTGFNAANPEMTPLTGETFYSRAGSSYNSFFQDSVLLADIGGVLPGHDLTPFANGAPGSLLYVFRTEVPVNQFVAAQLISEPDTWALLLLGMLSRLALSGGRSRSRRRLAERAANSNKR